MALLLKQTCLFRRIFSTNNKGFTQLVSSSTRLLNNDQRSHAKDTLVNDEPLEAPPPPAEPHLIYDGPMTRQVRSLKVFSLTTSVLGLSLQPFLFQTISASEYGAGVLYGSAGVLGFFTFMTPVFIHYVVKRYIIDITYDPKTDEYTASLFNFLPTTRKLVFKTDDVDVPDIPGALTSFHIKKFPVLCLSSSFIYPQHFVKFMGYDKPIDLKVPSSEKKTT